MNAKKECDLVRSDLPAYREGWLAPSRTAEISAHLAVCPACSSSRERDERLVEAIETLEPAAPPETTWVQVLAARQTRRRPVPLQWRPGLAVAAAILVVTMVGLRMQRGPAPPLPQQTRNTVLPAILDSGSFVVAHNMAFRGEMATDPNRAIILESIAQGRQGAR